MTPVDFQAIAKRENERRQGFECRILCCSSTPCLSSGSRQAQEAMQQTLLARNQTEKVQVVSVGCMGPCNRGPMVRVQASGQADALYQKVTPAVARAIVAEHAPRAGLAEDDLPHLRASLMSENDPFFTRQSKVVLANNGFIDPERIEDYIARGGYLALARVLREMTPQQVCEEIKRSGLRGRGGAGYPTGVKWDQVRHAKGERKFVVANGDEGDPGAYMDRTLMEDDPHQVLEGMIIAGYAIGARQGYLYVRGEYPMAVRRLRQAIQQARQQGILGSNVLDNDKELSFDLDIRVGAGAFVCGEETALMASIEGKRGSPRMRPPYPSDSGLWGFPTLINNVETFGNIAPILNMGAEKFSGIGTEKSKGTKIFSLTGKLTNTGLIEVPMGITLREIVYDIGGGIPNGRRFKAAQTGGPSGGCIPAEHLDTSVDYESLKALGSIMGSGGLVVMDDENSMPDVARYFMEFCVDESCGKCVPCRVGTVQLLRLLEKIVAGAATPGDLRKLEALCDLVQRASLCGLGQAAPNPVRSTLRYFRHEYDALIQQAAHAAEKESVVR